ncbi:MAG: 50S ribosomal protein L9 [bacterium]|nr:50S ribosomal protein L9 [bacterium]
MKVILIQDVEKLGNRGKVLEVKEGYARNFLLPKKLALVATPSNIKVYEAEKARYEKLDKQKVEDAKTLAGKIESLTLTITRKCGEEDKLFGSVTSADIQEALEAQGVVIDKRDIHLDEPLKTLGVHTLPYKIHKDVVCNIKVSVVKE